MVTQALPPKFQPTAQQRPLAVQLGDGSAGIGVFHSVGFGILVVFLFLIHSRIFDVKFSSLHIPGIAYRVTVAMMLFSRAFVPGLKHPIGRATYFFIFWFAASIPFSMWRGGSFSYLTGAGIPTFVVFLATSGLIVSYQQCQKAIATIAYGLFVLAIIAAAWGSAEETGRLYLPNGKFSNPNEMAQALTMGLPLWWWLFQRANEIGKKVFALGVMALMLLMISKCGSRGAMITIGAMVLVLFVRATITGKMKILVTGVMIIALLAGLMPSRLLRRYKTLSDDDQSSMSFRDADYDEQMENSAITSSQHRRDLLKRSIKYTLQHPLFGVGAGNFPVAEDADMRAQGYRKGTWQGTHNSYTQVSSELGIPALIAYVFVILVSLRITLRIHRRTRSDPRLSDISHCALALNLCLIVYAVSVFFDYIAYTSMLSVFSGLVMAFDLTVPQEIERRLAVPLQPVIPFAQYRTQRQHAAARADQVVQQW